MYKPELRPNTMEHHWMPFTANEAFKKEPRIVVKSKGINLWNDKGDCLLDGSSGLFCVPAGHGRKEIATAVYDAMLENDYISPFAMAQPSSAVLAQKVSSTLPDGMNKVFFVNSGSESVDTALKIVMAYHHANGEPGRIRYVSRERAYHGVNIGGTSLSGMIKNREVFSGTMPYIAHMRHTWSPEQRFTRGQPEQGAELANDLQRMVENFGAKTIAACFVEPVAGSTGVLFPPEGYLQRLREICDANGILLVFDEVITGFGRLGENFASDYFGVKPDIITMAKALTNGSVPMGAVAVTDDIYNTITSASPEGVIELFHGYTYSAHPLACAAGIVTQDIYKKESLFDKAAQLSDYFLDGLFSLRDIPVVYDIRGGGLMGAVQLKPSHAPGARGSAMQSKLFWAGLHVKFTGDNGILAPAFIATRSDIDNMIDVLRKCLSEESI